MGAILPIFKTRFSEYELVPDSGGKFEILVDDRLLYSKLDTGSFPGNDEIIKLLRKHL